MAHTGHALTVQHRQGQLAIRAQALRDFMAVWPVWQVAQDETFDRLVQVTLPLVRAYHSLSSTLAATYYTAIRGAAKARGTVAPVLAGQVDEAKVAAGMYATGLIAVRRSVYAGRTLEQAYDTAFVTTSGSVTRQILMGGRETILQSVRADRSAYGWERVTGGEPCDFCAMLADRGAVYKADTADFEAHDHCSCSAEPVFN